MKAPALRSTTHPKTDPITRPTAVASSLSRPVIGPSATQLKRQDMQLCWALNSKLKFGPPSVANWFPRSCLQSQAFPPAATTSLTLKPAVAPTSIEGCAGPSSPGVAEAAEGPHPAARNCTRVGLRGGAKPGRRWSVHTASRHRLDGGMA